MARKQVDNWDAYFTHRVDVQYRYWLRTYKVNVDKARDKNSARQVYSTWMHLLELVVTTDRDLDSMVSMNGAEINPAATANALYYDKLYKQFKFTRQLNNYRPVNVFLGSSLYDLVRNHFLNLVSFVARADHDKMMKAQSDARIFCESDLGRKHVVGWIAFCAARELIVKDIVQLKNINLESITEPKFELDNVPDQLDITSAKSSSSETSIFPVNEETFKAWYLYGEEVDNFDTEGKVMTHQEILDAIVIRRNSQVSKKTLARGYKMKRYIDKNCPKDLVHDLLKIYAWSKALKESNL